jgi:flagellar biosynthesis/type III secretory pathway M-ring protein FliF/YscJ
MDLLKKQLEKIQQQLTGLSASQKMLTASLVAIMVMTFVWWGRYASTSEMEPVFNSALSADDLNNVKRVLRAEGIPFIPSGDQILVPSEKKDYAVAALAYEQVLPKDSTGTFDDVFNKLSPFTPQSVTDKMSNVALQQTLARVISKMHDVAEAQVIIDPTHDRLFEGSVEPKATVNVRMRNGKQGSKKLAEAIAEWVSGSNAHMRRSRVSVIIEDRVYPIRDRDANTPDGEIDEQQANAEHRNEEKIKTALGYFSGDVIAVVTAKIDTVTSHKSATSHPSALVKEKSSESETTNTVTPQPAAAEPGTVPNSAIAVPQASAPGTSEHEKNRSENVVIPDEVQEDTSKPAGAATVVSATVSVPRSYFIKIAQSMNPSASSKEPDPADIDTAFAKERPTILEKVMHAVGLQDEKAVTVDMYFDAPLLMASGASTAIGTSSSSPMTVTLSGHMREIAIGLLALLSLFMVSMMVKKSAPPAPVVAAAIETQEPIMLGGRLDIAGEVSEGGQTLDGMELDEDAIKAQQMVEQVSTMVKENPDAAANMVKRWLNRS